eukprot:tig00020961_g16662.t1
MSSLAAQRCAAVIRASISIAARRAAHSQLPLVAAAAARPAQPAAALLARRPLSTAPGKPAEEEDDVKIGDPLPEETVMKLRIFDWGFSGALLLFFAGALGILGNPLDLIRKPEALRVAEDLVKLNVKLQEKLGVPVETGALDWAGGVDESRGLASFTIQVSGPNGTCVVHAKLARTRGRWEPFILEAQGEAAGRRFTLDLIAEKNQHVPAKPVPGSEAAKAAAAGAQAHGKGK